MNRWAMFETLSALLAPAPYLSPHESDKWDWDLLVALASEHMVTPALAGPVARLATAPVQASQYFSAIHDLNARRNEVVLDSLVRILSGLHEVGIEPVLLKGAASLIDGLYGHPAERIVGDIDLLVPPAQIDAAASRLHALDYREPEPDVPPRRSWIRHFSEHIPRLTHTETGVAVEIHRVLVKPPLESMLPAAAVLARARLVSWNDGEVYLPCPTDRVIHHIVHDQLKHQNFAKRRTELRQLRELACLTTRYADAIDWPEVERRFDRAGQGHVLRNRIAICAALMRVAIPLPVGNAAQALASLKATVSKSVPSNYRRLIQMYAYSFLSEPRLAINLLNPLWWPARIRNILVFLARDDPK
jgi:hypothetical protein